MNIHNIAVITFSPTGASRKVALNIAQGTGVTQIRNIDLTHAPAEARLSDNSLAIISVPVYGVKPAPMAVQRMQQISGNGTPAVVVAVYGNRHYESALEQLAALARDKGFKVIAAATFVGEHSYSTPATPIAVGRPDADDCAQAQRLGAAVMQKLSSGNVTEVDVAAIEQPAQPEGAMEVFHATIAQWKSQGVKSPRTPVTDPSLCVHCGSCVTLCPNQAIECGNECNTDADRCIKCCACVKGCPQKARTMPSPFAPLISKNFAPRKDNKVIL